MRIIILICTAITLLSCQQEIEDITIPQTTNNNNNTTNTANSLQQFYKANAAPIQKFTQNSSNYILVNTTNGNEILFYENSFQTLNNIPVTGDVSIEVKEVMTPAEMILNGLPTMSNGKPIESGGEFFVRVTQNGQTLKLRPGKFMQLAVPISTNAPGNMQVFRGDTSAGNVNWIPNPGPTNIVIDSFSTRILFSDSLSWTNIDKFTSEQSISYTVEPGNTPNVDSTHVYIHLTGRNMVLQFPRNGNKFFSSNMIAAQATIVGISIMNGNISYAFQPATLENGKSTTLSFTSISEAALKAKLATLK